MVHPVHKLFLIAGSFSNGPREVWSSHKLVIWARGVGSGMSHQLLVDSFKSSVNCFYKS